MPLIETRGAGSAQGFGSFAKSTEPLYVEDVFSTYLYTGNGGTGSRQYQYVETGVQLIDTAKNGTLVHLVGDGSIVDASPRPSTIVDNLGSQNPIITSSRAKFGGQSIYFGSSSMLRITPPVKYKPITIDGSPFCVRFWVNWGSSVEGSGSLFTAANDVLSTVLSLTVNQFSQWVLNAGGNNVIAQPSLNINQWYHVALTCNGAGVFELFIDGTSRGTVTVSPNYTQNIRSAFRYEISLSDTYIDDYQIISGSRIYTSNFTPPTTQQPLDTLVKSNGGLVWIKDRSVINSHMLFDTTRGRAYLQTNSTAISQTPSVTSDGPTTLEQINPLGFTVTTPTDGGTGASPLNVDGRSYVSWIFRKQPKFFDVVTYTGNGSALTVNHNLGSVPGCIIVKNVSGVYSWAVYHRSNGNDQVLYLNGTQAASTSATSWNSYTPTSTNFQVGGNAITNSNGDTYVAYLFAHNAGGFGASGSDNVISCASFITDPNGFANVELGFEPQFVLLKDLEGGAGQDWVILDTMRGWVNSLAGTAYRDAYLRPNLTSAEANFGGGDLTPTGFRLTELGGGIAGSRTYIFVAIRRPMKTPTSASQVFIPNAFTNNGSKIVTGFPIDLHITGPRSASPSPWPLILTRMQGLDTSGPASSYPRLTSSSTVAEVSTTTTYNGYDNTGFKSTSSGTSQISWAFKRAPGFLDIMCFTGTGGSGHEVFHNLGVVPEMIILKRRSSGGGNWLVNVKLGLNIWQLKLNSGQEAVNSTLNWEAPQVTSTRFYVGDAYWGTGNNSNVFDGEYIVYLFASLPGISKIGFYGGNNSSQTINCGFTSGSRFVIIKRFAGDGSGGNWFVWDTARGIVSGNDPLAYLNLETAEDPNFDAIDPDSSGFTVNYINGGPDVNQSGVTYLYLAIA